jgi:hypothetical protein
MSVSSPVLAPALVQSDNRLCQTSDDTDGAYWWTSTIVNGQWAASRGYVHRVYCFKWGCSLSSSEDRGPAWCKILAICDTLRRGHPHVLFVDSDALVRADVTMAELQQLSLCTSAADRQCGHVFFGAVNERSDVRDSARVHSESPVCTPSPALVLVRNTLAAMAALREWWEGFRKPKGAAVGSLFEGTGVAFNQSRHDHALWQLWPARDKAFRLLRRSRSSGGAGGGGGGVEETRGCARVHFGFPHLPARFWYALSPQSAVRSPQSSVLSP